MASDFWTIIYSPHSPDQINGPKSANRIVGFGKCFGLSATIHAAAQIKSKKKLVKWVWENNPFQSFFPRPPKAENITHGFFEIKTDSSVFRLRREAKQDSYLRKKKQQGKTQSIADILSLDLRALSHKMLTLDLFTANVID